jgi:polyvinyl alcohol dehydrogenase (cytochrome)
VKTAIRVASLLTITSILQAPFALAATEAPPRDPAEIYGQFCATCHEGGKVPRAPHAVQFPMIGPDQIYRALTIGAMQAQGSTLSEIEKKSIAEFLGGRTLASQAPPKLPACRGARARFDFSQSPPLAGWGMTPTNLRYVPAEIARLDAAEVPRLEVKWAFGFPGATQARSQPTIAGGAIYVGSQDGTVYALDFDTGCVRWTFKAGAEVRNSPVVEPWMAGDRAARPRVFIGDFGGDVYALDAQSGKQLWKTKVDPHPRATLTGSPRFFEGRVYVSISSNEWASAADPAYECCSFRGGVAALDAATGQKIWHAHAIQDEPRLTGRINSAGAAMRGPAGAPVWNSPTIDAKRRRVYVGTGEAYTSPAAATSDSVLAIDLDSGKLVWHYQGVADDAWNMACFIGGSANCPPENGPDLDIGASPILATLSDGRDLVLVGQKSGDVYALDPADRGRLIWRRKLGRGGVSGGVHWGMALAGDTLFAAVSDPKIMAHEATLSAFPGLNALDAATGLTPRLRSGALGAGHGDTGRGVRRRLRRPPARL